MEEKEPRLNINALIVLIILMLIITILPLVCMFYQMVLKLIN